jgi:hypothetical protein
MTNGLYYTAGMADRLGEALAAAARGADALLPMLRGWVGQNSYTRNVAGVNAMADRLAEAFDRTGLSLERHRGNGRRSAGRCSSATTTPCFRRERSRCGKNGADARAGRVSST